MGLTGVSEAGGRPGGGKGTITTRVVALVQQAFFTTTCTAAFFTTGALACFT